MREIKFRGWDKVENRMVNINSLDFPFNRPSGKHMSVAALEGNEWRSIDEVHLMQYTGLKDKNGKEIYEGDIVKRTFSKHSDYIGEVVFEDVTYFIKKDNGEDGAEYSFLANQHGFETEILGNIYENPELLQ